MASPVVTWVCHLVQNRFIRRHMSEFADLRPLDTAPLTPDTPARAEASPFDSDICRECAVNGIARLSTRYQLPFPINRIFRKPNADRLSLPIEDIRFLTQVVRLPQIGIEGALSMFRGQPSGDGRPNKALRSRLYRHHLASYSDLELLCSIADHGVVPHWHHPDARIGVRPVPHNYPSATVGANIVTHRLLKDYYAGRCILATVAALTTEPGFHSSGFALVPKQNVPLTRIIHDLSAPRGLSVNDATDSTQTPDAR
ncbi:hypothetical protein PHPALM_3108 [Phytophthora palmivora]|uniref:Pol protein n=1 Tax=Phytophthora palmivora TaxID=4796 RepID=A0A2P4YNB8_9STRA|nr:hypothetical protein PHPALM_3108 [Phytophthora palmivora]